MSCTLVRTPALTHKMLGSRRVRRFTRKTHPLGYELQATGETIIQQRSVERYKLEKVESLTKFTTQFKKNWLTIIGTIALISLSLLTTGLVSIFALNYDEVGVAFVVLAVVFTLVRSMNIFDRLEKEAEMSRRMKWERMGYDEYLRYSSQGVMVRGVILTPVPMEVQKSVAEKRKLLPGVRAHVEYFDTDPFLVLEYRPTGESYYTRVWDEPGFLVD